DPDGTPSTVLFGPVVTSPRAMRPSGWARLIVGDVPSSNRISGDDRDAPDANGAGCFSTSATWSRTPARATEYRVAGRGGSVAGRGGPSPYDGVGRLVRSGDAGAAVRSDGAIVAPDEGSASCSTPDAPSSPVACADTLCRLDGLRDRIRSSD